MCPTWYIEAAIQTIPRSVRAFTLGMPTDQAIAVIASLASRKTILGTFDRYWHRPPRPS